ncbi:aldose epimerase family protein [Streptomyces sp. NPDC004610]|uniref:aldose epimerase family protein n=1 Tax=unclassified Streptomyces TaxID=2593676 RepID=UPI00339E7612
MSEHFGTLPDGTRVRRWTFERAGVRVRVLSYGGIVQSVEVPGGVEVVLGFADLDGYLSHPGPYVGALVGRYANRIAGGRFPLDGLTYALARNHGGNALHGGERGFDKRVWDGEPLAHGVRLSRVSAHGEEGYPGRLEVAVTYALDPAGALRVVYEAVTDAPTPVNLTQHSYFNLTGGPGGAGGQVLRVAASRYLPVGADEIPTGTEPVEGTRFDFRTARTVGAGYDHNLVLDKGVTAGPVEVAELSDPVSGRFVTVATTEPGIQLYAADRLGEPFAPGAGIALETQHFPDSPNRPEFPDTVLRPGGVYRSETVYGFGAR